MACLAWKDEGGVGGSGRPRVRQSPAEVVHGDREGRWGGGMWGQSTGIVRGHVGPGPGFPGRWRPDAVALAGKLWEASSEGGAEL